jgi:dipeptidyl aminopeptidase/acylaminoacyl peptidase
VKRRVAAPPVARRCLVVLVASLAGFSPVPAQFFDRATVTDATLAADGETVVFTERAPMRDRDAFGFTLHRVSARGGAVQPLVAGRRPAFAPVGTALAFISAGQRLVVRDAITGEDRVLSGDSLRVDAFRWSPDATTIAFSAGSALHVVPVAGGLPRRLTADDFQVGPAEPELPDLIEFDWLGTNRLVVSGRAQGATDGLQAASLHILDVSSGDLRYLTGRGGRWHLPVVSPNGEWIAFTGQALGPAGWMASEIIVVKADGTGLRRLTAGRDLDALDLAWASDSRILWFATEERGTRNLMRVDSRNGRVAPGTSGTHLLMLQGIARRGDWALAVRATAVAPGALIRFPLNAPHEMQVLHEPAAAEMAGELEELDLAVPGTGNMHGWLVRPPQFDAARRYPLLVDIHGGPHAMAGAGYAPFALAHAAAGWLVLRLNPRGSTGFGFDLSNGLDQRWPGRDVDDLRAVISALVERGLVDSTRIAAVGTGAGAAVAAVLRAADPRITATISRCADGDWLPGGGGIDRPLWSEWYAARPFAQTAMAWWRNFATAVDTRVNSPLLLIRGVQHTQAVAIADAVRSHAAAWGADVREVIAPGGCREAGPVMQQRWFEEEREMLGKLKS